MSSPNAPSALTVDVAVATDNANDAGFAGRSPTSPTPEQAAASRRFDLLVGKPMPKWDLPHDYHKALLTKDVEDLLSQVERLSDAYLNVIDDVNNNDVRIWPVYQGGARLETLTVAKWMQPKLALDASMKRLKRKIRELDESNDFLDAMGMDARGVAAPPVPPSSAPMPSRVPSAAVPPPVERQDARVFTIAEVRALEQEHPSKRPRHTHGRASPVYEPTSPAYSPTAPAVPGPHEPPLTSAVAVNDGNDGNDDDESGAELDKYHHSSDDERVCDGSGTFEAVDTAYGSVSAMCHGCKDCDPEWEKQRAKRQRRKEKRKRAVA